MTSRRTTAILFPLYLLLAALALTACNDTGDAQAGDEAAASQPPVDPSAGLPPGHPPSAAATSGSGMIAPPPAGSGTGAAGLTWTVPGDWVAETPSSAMRRAQYRVPGPGGDAELVVFYFGPGQGGDAMSNAMRWAGQFSQPDGSDPAAALVTEEIRVDDIPVLLAEVGGIYSGGMAMMGGPAEQLADYLLLGAVAEGGDANWFFKLTGPAATVESHRAGFRAMIESLERGG